MDRPWPTQSDGPAVFKAIADNLETVTDPSWVREDAAAMVEARIAELEAELAQAHRALREVHRITALRNQEAQAGNRGH